MNSKLWRKEAASINGPLLKITSGLLRLNGQKMSPYKRRDPHL